MLAHRLLYLLRSLLPLRSIMLYDRRPLRLLLDLLQLLSLWPSRRLSPRILKLLTAPLPATQEISQNPYYNQQRNAQTQT